MNFFSIVTATYNREKLLPRLYKSLLAQKKKNFEWIIVDDGSDDNSIELINSWINEKLINIVLIKQENSGKHRAINNGMKFADSYWVAVIDSDDWLTENALERAEYYINDLKLNSQCDVAGLIFNSMTADGSVLGTEFPNQVFCGKTFNYYQQNNIKGDKFDFYKTKIIQSNPFPEISGEKFISEGIIWNRINLNYFCYFINEGHQYVEYQTDGLSDISCLSRVSSPSGSSLCYYESAQLPIRLKRKFRNLINYYRFRFHGGNPGEKTVVINYIVDFSAILIGYFAFMKDKYSIYRKSKNA